MANKPFDREVINVRERPLSSDINSVASYADLEVREILLRSFAARGGTTIDAAVPWPPVGAAAFYGAGYHARCVTGAMQVQLDPGLGWYNDNSSAAAIGGVVGVDDQSPIKPLTLTAPETISVPVADPANPRIDIIEVAVDRRSLDASSRDVMSPTSGQFIAGSVLKTLSYNQNGRSTVNGAGSINYKTGVAAAAPVPASTDSGYVKIAEVDVPAAATQVLVGNIRDVRLLANQAGMVPFALWVRADTIFNQANLARVVAPPGVQFGVVSTGPSGGAGLGACFGLSIIAGGMPSAAGAPVASWAPGLKPGIAGVGQIVQMHDWVANTVGASAFADTTKSKPTMVVGNNQQAWTVTLGMVGATAATIYDYNITGWIPFSPA